MAEPPHDNPFDYLTLQHQQNLTQARLKQKEKLLELERLRDDYQVKTQEKNGFDELVTEVLFQLRQAMYPNWQVNFPNLNLRSEDQSWSIGMWCKGNDSALTWGSVLEVRPVFDDLSGKALYFECFRHHRKIQAELNREDLQNALKQLYPLPRERNQQRARKKEKLLYDSMVQRAFESFQNSTDPQFRLLSDHETWAIGKWEYRTEAREWKNFLEIQLNYDRKNKASSFKCRGLKRSANAELDQEKLAEALKKVSG
jgi:hypothetical protein